MTKESRGSSLILWVALALGATTSASSLAGVGRTPGFFGVSNGSANYTIPIFTPPGAAGVQPAIALVYNSNAGLGAVGKGWILSGMSMIGTCTKTIAQDGVAGYGSDVYCIDGRRLRNLSGSLEAGGEWATEVADFSRIKTYLVTTPYPHNYWTVETKDGLKHTYEGWGDKYTIAETSDRDGNKVRYTYNGTFSTNWVLPDKIEWTRTSSSTSTSFLYSMEFGYSSTEPLALLTTISIKTSSTLVRKYNLHYETSPTSGVKRLDSITECAGSTGTDCLAPTEIEYQDGIVGVSSTPILATSGTYGAKGQFDYNGDGKNDLTYWCGYSLCVRLATSGGSFGGEITTPAGCGDYGIGDPFGNGRDVMLGTNGTNYRQICMWTGSGFSMVSTGVAISDFYGAILADINGDGRDDLLTWPGNVEARLSGSSGSTLTFGSPTTVTLSGFSYAPTISWLGADQYGTVSWWPFWLEPQGYNPWVKRNRDANGDGVEDLKVGANLWLDYPPVYWGECSLFPEGCFPGYQGWEYYTALYVSGAPMEYSENIWSLTDSFHAGNANNYCMSNASYPAYSQYCILGGSGIQSQYPVRGLIDWNGDGAQELLVQVGGNSTLSVVMPTGLVSTSIPSTCSYFAIDADGDGLDDAGCIINGSGTYVYLHNGAGVTPDLATRITDGYGLEHLIQYETSNSSTVYTPNSSVAAYPLKDVNTPRVLVRTTTLPDGTGSTYTVTYHYTGAVQNLEGRGGYGFKQIVAEDSRADPVTQKHIKRVQIFDQGDFRNAGQLLQEKVYQTNLSGDTEISVTTNTLSYLELDSGATSYRYWPFIATSVTDQYEVGGSRNGALITRTATANSTPSYYGNFTTVTKTLKDMDSSSPFAGEEWTTTTTLSFAPNTSYWCLGLPESSSTVETSTASGASSVTRSQSFVVDPIKCRVTQVTIGSGSLQVATDYEHDDFGNVDKVTVTGRNPNGSSMTPRVSETTWGSADGTPGGTGQFAVKFEDALNLNKTTDRTFNSTYGSLVTERDPNGILVESNEYDDFGRVSKSAHADGTYEVYNYGLAASGTNPMAVYTIGMDSYASDDSLVRHDAFYMDRFERAVNEYHYALSGGYSVESKGYDAFGRVAWEGAPFHATTGYQYTPTYVTTNKYDLLGRPTEQSHPRSESDSTAVTTTYAYAGRVLTSTGPPTIDVPGGSPATKIVDVNGRMRKSTDANGYYQTFNYDAGGNLKQVVDTLSNALFNATYSYGIQAFQTSTTDMDLGTWNYVYNSLGELVSWQDPKAYATNPGWYPFSQTYDEIGRVVTRDEPEGTTTFVFGTSDTNHNIGRLTGKSMTANSYAETLSYDTLGRLSTRSITTDGHTYNIDSTYNKEGSLEFLTYPTSTSSTRVKIKYDYSLGILQSVTDWTTGSAGTVYWIANTQNPRGQTTRETLGNGVETNRFFDLVTGRLDKITSGTSGGGTGLQNLIYAYDDVGNVTQRMDTAPGTSLIENFFYDGMYRLEESTLKIGTGSPSTNLTMTYDDMGNITSKDGNAYNYNTAQSGCNYYSNTQRHAVRKVGSRIHCYDANGNMTVRGNDSIDWTSYNYPSEITTPTGQVIFSYGPDRQYYKQEYSGSGVAETTYYIGGILEKVSNGTTTDWRHQIAAEGQIVAIVSRKSSGSNPNTVSYPLEDNQGSITTIADGGSVTALARASYGAFGEQRDGDDWSGPESSGDLSTIEGLTRRGYTGHSMLTSMGLIHMNGRMQDSISGRFLSPDPYLQNPGFTQNYNRYSYVENNPLTYIDPSGFDCEGPIGSPGCPIPLPLAYDGPVNYCGLNSECYLNHRRTWNWLGQMCALIGPNCQFQMDNNVVDQQFGASRSQVAPLTDRSLVNRFTPAKTCKTATCQRKLLADAGVDPKMLDWARKNHAALVALIAALGPAAGGKAARGITVIGPEATYRAFAQEIGANFLNVTREAWSLAKNQRFLDEVIRRGDDVLFAGRYLPGRLNPNSVLAFEIRYLLEAGYRWTKDFSALILRP